MTEAVETATSAAEQWLDVLLTQNREQRIRMAQHAVRIGDDTRQGQQCWMQDHDRRIEDYIANERAVAEALDEITRELPEMSEAGRTAAGAVLSRIGDALRLHGRWQMPYPTERG